MLVTYPPDVRSVYVRDGSRFDCVRDGCPAAVFLACRRAPVKLLPCRTSSTNVAFSLLGRDEPLARKLNDVLADRLKTFIYSDTDRQVKLLAGRDGEDAFARVFGAEARTVVVLYRTEWGEQGFTAVESTGIRTAQWRRDTTSPLSFRSTIHRLVLVGCLGPGVVRAGEVRDWTPPRPSLRLVCRRLAELRSRRPPKRSYRRLAGGLNPKPVERPF